MTTRPVYIPTEDESFVKVELVNFTWHPGFSITQKQKSIISLHENIREILNLDRILEISTKSSNVIGVKASAFNLMLKWKGSCSTVESYYQGSKVFKNGGPYIDLYKKESILSKKDERIRNSGELLQFSFDDQIWGIDDNFYSWLYIMALSQNTDITDKLVEYNAFTDIEFNPKKSFNCQAYSAALYISAIRAGLNISDINTYEKFKQVFPKRVLTNIQKDLF